MFTDIVMPLTLLINNIKIRVLTEICMSKNICTHLTIEAAISINKQTLLLIIVYVGSLLHIKKKSHESSRKMLIDSESIHK